MIEIIVVGRADNHTGDFTGRLLYASKFNSRALSEAGVKHQFTFVEWNSPFELVGTVAAQFRSEVPNSKAYVVGPEWHTIVCDNPNMVIMEFFAKNVALRRSTADVAVCTNADILFGPDTVELIAGWTGCHSHTLYRTVHRKDIRSDRTYENVDELADPQIVVKDWIAKPPSYTQGAGDFQMARVDYWRSIGGYDETIRWAKIHKDHRMCSQVIKLKGSIVAKGSCYHLYHASSYVNQKRMPPKPPWGPEYNPESWLPYRNPSNWGLAKARTVKIAGLDFAVPPTAARKIPDLPSKPLPIGVPRPKPASPPKPARQIVQPPRVHGTRVKPKPPKPVRRQAKPQEIVNLLRQRPGRARGT
jgi:hypothetical protein